MIRFLKLFLILGVVGFPLRASWFPGAQGFVLKNGMQVVVLSNHKAPMVSHNLWIKAGSIDDPFAKSGLAHFLEHLMLKGGGGVPIDMFEKELDRMGARHNASTTWDYTRYFQEIPSRYLERVMMIMSARLKNLELNQAIVDSERQVILEERFMRFDNKPRALLSEAIMRALFWNHPYGNSMIGWRHEMESLNLDDVLQFHKTYYDPQNCILMLAGDITLEKAKELAEKHYGKVSSEGQVRRKHLQEPLHHHICTHLTLKHERVGLALYDYSFRLPRSHSKKDMRLQGLYELLMVILSDKPTGLLYQEFVLKQKIVSDVNFWFLYPVLEVGFGGINIVPNEPGKKNRKILKDVRKFLKNLKIKQQDLDRARKKILAQDAHKRDHIFAGVDVFGEYMVRGYDLEQVQQGLEFIKNATLEEIQKCLDEIMKQKTWIETTLLPKGKGGATTGGSDLDLTTSLGRAYV